MNRTNYLGIDGWTKSPWDDAVFSPSNVYGSGDTASEIIEAVKKSLGYVDNPLTKCRHCGQWGAVYCPCAHCGAPIDP